VSFRGEFEGNFWAFSCSFALCDFSQRWSIPLKENSFPETDRFHLLDERSNKEFISQTAGVKLKFETRMPI